MIALDANMLVRYFVEDDPEQATLARGVIEDRLSSSFPGFVSLIVLVELSWVLRRVYECTAGQVAEIFSHLMSSPVIVVEQADQVAAALRFGCEDLADGLLHAVGQAHGCSATVTFDRHFAKLAGVELVA